MCPSKPCLLKCVTLMSALISNCMPNKVWDEISYPFPNFNGSTVREWISNFITHITVSVITYPCAPSYLRCRNTFENFHQQTIGKILSIQATTTAMPCNHCFNDVTMGHVNKHILMLLWYGKSFKRLATTVFDMIIIYLHIYNITSCKRGASCMLN